MENYVVVITEVNKSDNYQIGKDNKKFETLEQAVAWIKQESKGHKTKPVFRDGKDGQAFKVGYVWSYWDQYNGEKGKFLHEIWTDILHEKIEPVYL